MSMSIEAKEGQSVVYVNPTFGSSSDQTWANTYLVLGQTYTVTKTIVCRWETRVFLDDCSGTHFNSVRFDDVE